MNEEREVKLNITEIVRAEVRQALKEILGQVVRDERDKVQSSGDYQMGDIKPLDDRIGKPKQRTDNEHDGEKHNPMFPLPVVVKHPDGTIEHRRAKRTQSAMKEAITKAIPVVAAKHPKWSERRVKRLAVNLVRRYKL